MPIENYFKKTLLIKKKSFDVFGALKGSCLFGPHTSFNRANNRLKVSMNGPILFWFLSSCWFVLKYECVKRVMVRGRWTHHYPALSVPSRREGLYNPHTPINEDTFIACRCRRSCASLDSVYRSISPPFFLSVLHV